MLMSLIRTQPIREHRLMDYSVVRKSQLHRLKMILRSENLGKDQRKANSTKCISRFRLQMSYSPSFQIRHHYGMIFFDVLPPYPNLLTFWALARFHKGFRCTPSRCIVDTFAPSQAARCAICSAPGRIQRACALLIPPPYSSLARAPPATPFVYRSTHASLVPLLQPLLLLRRELAAAFLLGFRDRHRILLAEARS
jgi:hypothetical protein